MEYVVIDSLEVFVRVSTRQPDNSWKSQDFTGAGQRIWMEAIESGISPADIYSDIALKAAV